MKPNNLQMISHIAHHFGMPLSEVATVLKVPTHPASMRDEFAARAATGVFVSPWDVKTIAARAYAVADAMLAARTGQAAPEPAAPSSALMSNTAQWYDELLELLGATSQFDAKHLINELTAAKIDEAEARATVTLYRALGVRDQEAALAKIKELTK